jgi:hypothetical protein
LMNTIFDLCKTCAGCPPSLPSTQSLQKYVMFHQTCTRTSSIFSALGFCWPAAAEGGWLSLTHTHQRRWQCHHYPRERGRSEKRATIIFIFFFFFCSSSPRLVLSESSAHGSPPLCCRPPRRRCRHRQRLLGGGRRPSIKRSQRQRRRQRRRRRRRNRSNTKYLGGRGGWT